MIVDDPTVEAAYVQRARTRPATFEDVLAGPTEGLALAPLRGLGGAFDYAAGLAAEVGTPFLRGPARSLDAVLGTDATGWLDRQRNLARERVDLWRHDPLTTGWASQIVADLFRMGGEAVAGYALGGPVGAAALTGGAEGVAGYRRSVAEGLDPATAEKIGAIEGATAGAGVVLPMVGPTLRASIALGVGGNVALGGAQRFGAAEVLARAGYPEQAAQFRVFDSQAVATDAILGAAFGGIGHALTRRPTPAAVDAALAVKESMHVEQTAPGIPADPGTSSTHARALDDALGSLLRDEPVAVRPDPASEFVRDPAAEAFRVDVEQALADAYPEARRSKTAVQPERDSISTAVAKLGGLDLDAVRAEWGPALADDRIALNRMAWSEGGPFGKHVLRRGGRSIDDMATVLAERGYLRIDEFGKVADLGELFDRLAAEAGGARQFTPEGAVARAERERALEQRDRDAEDRAEREAIQWEANLPAGLADVVVTDRDGNAVRAGDAQTLLQRARQEAEVEKRLLQVAANCEAALT